MPKAPNFRPFILFGGLSILSVTFTLAITFVYHSPHAVKIIAAAVTVVLMRRTGLIMQKMIKDIYKD